ncbi:MAG: oxetanocin resistance protein [Devosia sp.]|nr:oxetanocin resistance protein [Devosia sp.]
MGRRPRCKNDSNVVRLYGPIARSRTIRTLVANATTSLRSATLTATTVLEILMDVAMLRADCARCAGLCCVVLAFDRSALFAEDKPAGTPCIHLGSDCRCRIHASRKQRGYAGCVSYDCLGAGQRATALLIGCAATAVEQFEVFAAIHRQHELLTLLHAAGPASKRQACRPSTPVAGLVPGYTGAVPAHCSCSSGRVSYSLPSCRKVATSAGWLD